MADAYGMLTFDKSTDCEFDGLKLEKLINEFEWDNSGIRWKFDEESGYLWIERESFFGQPQYPTVYPRFTSLYRVEGDDGELRDVSPVDMREEDFEHICDGEDEICDLESLSKAFSPLIKNGWIEIACTANEKARYVYFESLRIYADGKALRRSIYSGPMTSPVDNFEEFSPQEMAV
ncbi:hypothetical protein ICN30_08510 [Polynucleobacter sp. 31A-FELB]|uniref:hypothetical protein n=1 Tax=Polynucleobacter sp. 31A-FELB TaxID=2689096 RepID=UPI001C0DD079|nr:hypothetical protein [Polynucleobacter sp. 31A-FELB]MBU3587873.1 hypothetical protein [Polynucleobacter sp. 31A-FELB]